MTRLDKEFEDFFRECSRADPAAKRELPLPASTVALIATTLALGGPRYRTGAQLVVLAYFFMLRVGEYTPPSNKRRPKLTVALRKCDIVLHLSGRPLPPDAPWSDMLRADGVAICLANQKNGTKDQTLYHEKGLGLMDPVVAAANLLQEIRGLPAHTPIGTFRGVSGWDSVTDRDILALIRRGAIADGLPALGFDPALLGTHSLRIGGATRLAMLGISEAVIKQLGHWSAETWQLYVRPHISGFTKGLARLMANPLRFSNVRVR